MRPGTVCRSLLIERPTHDDSRPIVSVVAPPGFGKTRLLSQWAEANGQAFAWVSVEELDNDPKVLLTYVAEALDAVEPIDQRVFDALASPGSSVPGVLGARKAVGGRVSSLALSMKSLYWPGLSTCTACGRKLCPPLADRWNSTCAYTEVLQASCMNATSSAPSARSGSRWAAVSTPEFPSSC